MERDWAHSAERKRFSLACGSFCTTFRFAIPFRRLTINLVIDSFCFGICGKLCVVSLAALRKLGRYANEFLWLAFPLSVF